MEHSYRCIQIIVNEISEIFILALSASDWRNRYENIDRNIYILIVRPKLDYRSIVYSSAIKSLLNVLNVIPNNALRMGAYRVGRFSATNRL